MHSTWQLGLRLRHMRDGRFIVRGIGEKGPASVSDRIHVGDRLIEEWA